ncbi:sensor histidine kinase [Vulcanococcus limneticus]|uniref:sensor histidine kinase n=1 Tax=Vulcanococcus limneticus TaxID=2170428 RepID=UPI00398C15AE
MRLWSLPAWLALPRRNPAWLRHEQRTGHPARSLRRQQVELFLLYLGSLAALLLVVAAVVRAVSREAELSHLRGQLSLIGEDLASLPLPRSGSERHLQESHKDFTTAHQQVEWFLETSQGQGHVGPVSRLGEVRNLGKLPPRLPGRRFYWQEGPGWLALVRPVDAPGSRGVWLRISAGLEPLEKRLRQLDLALALAVLLALLLSGVCSWLLTRRAVQPLERSLARLRQFSMDASHELRGPLAALAANAEMGLLDCEAPLPSRPSPAVLPGTMRLPDPQRRRFEAIASATEQMQQLVDDLLLLARQDEQRLEDPRPLDFSRLVEQQLDLHRDGLALADHPLALAIEPGLTVLGQAALLQRLVRNLLDNAQRYTPRGGAIGVALEGRGGLACLAVTDAGVGLSAEELPRVFDRFWRASAERGRGGTGLGLAIAARICAAHGGSIRVASRPGEGSCFRVELPLQS